MMRSPGIWRDQSYSTPRSWGYRQKLVIQCGCWTPNSGPLHEQCIFLTTEPSLQSQCESFKKRFVVPDISGTKENFMGRI